MGQYNKAVLTTAGENLIARALAGEMKLNITKAKTSSYAYPSGTDLKSLTDMQGIKQTAADPATAVYDNTMIQTRVLFSNEEIVSTYYIHNIGLYAMVGTQEVLFCIVTAETPDEMPQYNGAASTSYIYNIQNVVQDAAQLNITVNPSGTATIQEVLERVDATGGDISETVIETLDTVEDKYPVPAAGESVKRFFGKVLTFLRNIRPLTGNITLYVSANIGSDITGDGSQSKPFKTIQHAIDLVPRDLNWYTATINVSAGSYPESVNINAFRNGSLYLWSDTRNTLADTCRVSDFTISKCGSGYVRLNGFNTTNPNYYAVLVDGSYGVYISYCQSTISAPLKTGIQCNGSYCNIDHCKIANRNHAASFSSSVGTSESWDAGSTGNFIGISSIYGSKVSMIGTQATSSAGIINDRYQETGGAFFYQNGTQIIGMVSSGISCTWGITSGGYVRHGNLIGTAMVTINIAVTLNTVLNAWQVYSVLGFPIPTVAPYVAVTCNVPSHFYSCTMNTMGGLELTVHSANLPAGNIYYFSVTYLTTS